MIRACSMGIGRFSIEKIKRSQALEKALNGSGSIKNITCDKLNNAVFYDCTPSMTREIFLVIVISSPSLGEAHTDTYRFCTSTSFGLKIAVTVSPGL